MSIRSGESSRRRARKDMRDERKLTMRHRWYAGGIAALVSGALMFTGYTPAMADDTSSTASTADASTPVPSPSPSDTPSAPSPSATVTATPSPSPSPTASQTTAPKTRTQTQQSVQAPV